MLVKYLFVCIYLVIYTKPSPNDKRFDLSRAVYTDTRPRVWCWCRGRTFLSRPPPPAHRTTMRQKG